MWVGEREWCGKYYTDLIKLLPSLVSPSSLITNIKKLSSLEHPKSGS